MGCNIIEWNAETRQIRNLGDTSQTHIHGNRKIRQQTRRWNHVEQEVEAKNYWCWIHQWMCHLHHDRGKPPTHQTDECILHPLGICGPPHRKMYKTIEKHTENCKRYIHTIGGDFNAEQGLGHGTECISIGRYTLTDWNRRGDWMKHWLMLQGCTALNTMYRKTPQKQTTFISPRRKKDWLHSDQEKVLEIQQGRRSQRHDSHGKRPQMCHGYFHDQHAWEEHSHQEYKKARHYWTWWTRTSRTKQWSREAWARKNTKRSLRK